MPSLPLLFTAAALLGAGQAVNGAARILLMRSVVPPEQLTQALTRDEVRMNGSALAGPALGGALYAVRALAHAIPFLFTAGSFLIALITAALMKTPASRPASTRPAGGSTAASRNMLAGVRTLWDRTRQPPALKVPQKTTCRCWDCARGWLRVPADTDLSFLLEVTPRFDTAGASRARATVGPAGSSAGR